MITEGLVSQQWSCEFVFVMTFLGKSSQFVSCTFRRERKKIIPYFFPLPPSGIQAVSDQTYGL